MHYLGKKTKMKWGDTMLEIIIGSAIAAVITHTINQLNK